MIRHLIRTSLLFLTLCNGALFGVDQEVKVIHSMLDIHPFVTPNSVVILDLDNTLITTTTDLGNAEWYYSWLQVEQAKGVSRQEAQKSLQSTWLWLQNFAEYQLTESNIPYLLKSLRQSPGVTLFSITGRVPESSKVTQDVLDKLNISLLKPSQAKWEFNFYTPHPIFFSEGIVFVGLNKKSAIIRQIIHNLQLKKIPFDRVVLVDDRRINVEETKKVCQDLNIDYVGLQYTHANSSSKDFNLARSHKQFEILKHGLSNHEAETLLATKQGSDMLHQYLDPIQFPKRKDTTLTFLGKQPSLNIHTKKSNESRIIESYHIDEVIRYASPDSLLVLGLGETIITSKTLLGSSTWGWEMINHNLSKGISFEEASDNLIPLWNYLSAKVSYKTVEINTPDTLRKLKRKGVPMIAITAHYIEVAHPIISKLENLGIKFSASKAAQKDFTLHTPYPAKFISGIIFTGFQNSKGDAFLKYLDQSEIKFNKLIFVDDSLENIEEMEKAAMILNKPFLGIWYKAGQYMHKSLHPDIAKLQWIFLNKIVPNQLIDKLIKEKHSA